MELRFFALLARATEIEAKKSATHANVLLETRRTSKFIIGLVVVITTPVSCLDLFPSERDTFDLKERSMTSGESSAVELDDELTSFWSVRRETSRVGEMMPRCGWKCQ